MKKGTIAVMMNEKNSIMKILEELKHYKAPEKDIEYYRGQVDAIDFLLKRLEDDIQYWDCPECDYDKAIVTGYKPEVEAYVSKNIIYCPKCNREYEMYYHEEDGLICVMQRGKCLK